MSAFSFTPAQHRAMDKLASDATHIALLGGSRSGKTFLFCYAVMARLLQYPGMRAGIFRFRMNALKSSVMDDTMPKVWRSCFPELPSHGTLLNKQDNFVKLPNGSQIWYGGLDDKDRAEKILGMEFATIYFNECSQIPYGSVKMALTRLAQQTGAKLRAYYDFNPPSKAHWTYKVFMEGKSPDTGQPLKAGDYAWDRINPRDNAENLGSGYIEQLEAMPQRDRLRFLEGMFSEAMDGALWTIELLDQQRAQGELPNMVRIVVAVDPSGVSGEEDKRSDEVGIIVMGLANDNCAYVLEDLSGRHSPAEWARIAVGAYERFNASAIVAERNYGGAMVEAVIRSAGTEAHVKLVTASVGKAIRAEPIANLYERQRIWHAGRFPQLEEQLCGFSVSGYQGIRSPDRADALVWAASELFQQMTSNQAERPWSPPKVHAVARSASRLAGRY